MHYNTYLDTLDLRYRAIYLDYIVKYGVEMEQFEPSHYSNYTSVNEWFIRQVKPEYRPVAQGVSDIVSPADARVTMWSNNPFGLRFWIKGNRFTMDEFLTDAGQPRLFDGGTLVLLRLAPQDYHRFHAILLSTMVAMFAVEGGLQSVNRDGMTSKNYGRPRSEDALRTRALHTRVGERALTILFAVLLDCSRFQVFTISAP